MKRLSVIPYTGGKYNLIREIVPIIEWCATTYNLKEYMEICGGGARMLLNISTTKFERRLYNDINLGLCNLFASLRNPNMTLKLMDRLLNLEYNDRNFSVAKNNYDNPELDIITSAAYTYLIAHQSRAGNMRSFDKNHLFPENYYNSIYGLQSYSVVLKGVEVTCGNALDILSETKNNRDSFCYLDVPYVVESKRSNQHSYKEEKEQPFDHLLLVELLLETNMKVALSGYDNHPYYDSLNEQNGWNKIFLKELFVSSSGKNGITAEEYLWINFEIPSYLINR